MIQSITLKLLKSAAAQKQKSSSINSPIEFPNQIRQLKKVTEKGWIGDGVWKDLLRFTLITHLLQLQK